MKKLFTTVFLGTLLCFGNADAAVPRKVTEAPSVTVLESVVKSDRCVLQNVEDASGHIYRRHLIDGKSMGMHRSAPLRTEATSGKTFYESFEGYDEWMGLNWIPAGWSKINTPEHAPTELNLQHNINNSWYVYYSTDGWGFTATTDGEKEAFIHFGYDAEYDGYGSSSAAQDEWLVTPDVLLGEEETLSFMLEAEPFSAYPIDWDNWCVADRSHAECNMQVMLTADNGETWTCIWDWEKDYISGLTERYIMNSELEWNTFSVSLAAYAGRDVRIAFRYLRDAGDFVGNSMCVDAVTVSHATAPEYEEWELLGTGSMADGWVVPALTLNPGEFYNPEDYIFPVRIYQHKTNAGLYMIESPYTSAAFPFKHLNGATLDYNIVINATDHDFVVVDPQISGFEHNNPGSKSLRYSVPYIILNAACYYLGEGYTPAEIQQYGYASVFDEENGKIIINQPQYGHPKPDGTLDMGYSCGGVDTQPTVITLPGHNTEPVWESAGMGHLEDGFIYPGYFGDPAGKGWEVEVFVNNQTPGVYMVKNPYTNANSPLSELHSGEIYDTMVKIDATNPEIVVIVPQYSGFNGYITGSEPSTFYIGNLAGSYVSEGTSISDLQYLSADKKDYVDNDVIYIRNHFFGSNATSDFGYKWVDENDEYIEFTTRLYLPWSSEKPDLSGVSVINGNLNSAPAIYNLQGILLNKDVESLPEGIYIIGGKKVKK